ncbi:hypothetical protein ALC53_09136, partial [Atta colombica]
TIEPTILSIIGYTVVVHLKAKTYLKGSAYTYLAGRKRGIFRCNEKLIIVCDRDGNHLDSVGGRCALILFIIFFAILINISYCFMYKYNERGKLITTNFFRSRWFNLQTWLQFIIFGLIAAYLLIANLIMIYLMRRAPQAERDVESKNICEGNRLRVITSRLTIMLGIVFLFLVGELPTHLASRRSAVSLL